MKKILPILSAVGLTAIINSQIISCSNNKINYEDLIIPEYINVEGLSIEEKIDLISSLEDNIIAILGEDIFNKAEWTKLKEYKLGVNYTNYLINKKPDIYSWNDKEWSKIINLQNNLIKVLPLWLEKIEQS